MYYIALYLMCINYVCVKHGVLVAPQPVAIDGNHKFAPIDNTDYEFNKLAYSYSLFTAKLKIHLTIESDANLYDIVVSNYP